MASFITGMRSAFDPLHDVDPRSPGRMLCVPENVGAVVDAVEIDRLAVVVRPGGLRRRGDPTILASVDQQSMCDIISSCLDMSRPPHQARHAPTALSAIRVFYCCALNRIHYGR